jgi:hypothetical protein
VRAAKRKSRKGLKGPGHYWGGVIAGCYSFQRERRDFRGEERADGWVPQGSEREREREGAGLVSFQGWLGRFGPRVQPSWAVPFFFLFFVLIPFSYFLISCFRFCNSYTSLI